MTRPWGRGSLHLPDDSISFGDKCRIPESSTETDGFKNPHPSCKALVQQVINKTPSHLAAPGRHSSQYPATTDRAQAGSHLAQFRAVVDSSTAPLCKFSRLVFQKRDTYLQTKHSLATKTRNELSSASCAPGNCSS